ncbi:hypothetical protein B0T16DRAFT_104230 [Cercophora newfieldiana]|uniref:FAD-binding domain-containing protein n=1 Tax=Cercophora newfieldiana TaxID=92897 RepID=A0AA39YHZ6_9PEZI|nr:hypothetical protein B0T16DRAFT_104230 [Cercophora newfieldiana]
MPPFKVIIVGGGPAGLITGHCLTKAGIEFEILEARASHDANAGASNALWPQSVRVFDQLGLLEEAKKLYTEVNFKACVLADGTMFYKSEAFARVEEQHGHPFMLFHRGELLDMLDRRLPDRESHVHNNKRVAAIETSEHGVKVVCADGSAFEGSLVIGADGVHSTVRQLMEEKSPQPPPEEAMSTTYIGLYGSCPRLPKTESGTFYETHGPKFSLQLGVGHTRNFFVVYHRLEKTTKARHRFTDEEKEALAVQYAETYITPDYKFEDIWKTALWSHLAHIEEGLVDKWYGDRIVLLGDNVHKMTPNVGFGFNNAISSAAALTNGLRRLILEKTQAGDPAGIDTEALTRVFADYEKIRKAEAKKYIEISANYSRNVAWDNLLFRVIDRYITPFVHLDVFLLKQLMSPQVREGVVLDFLEEKDFKEGKVKWKHPRQKLASTSQDGDGDGKDDSEDSA